MDFCLISESAPSLLSSSFFIFFFCFSRRYLFLPSDFFSFFLRDLFFFYSLFLLLTFLISRVISFIFPTRPCWSFFSFFLCFAELAASILGWWRWVCSDEERTSSWGINGGWASGSDGVNVEGWVRRRGRAGMVAAWAGPASTTLLGIDRARGGNLVRTGHRVGNWACGWAEVTPPGVHGLNGDN